MSLATYGQVGSVWGTAFDRAQNAAYVSASYKRISDLGPLGLGGIYRDHRRPRRRTGRSTLATTAAVEDWLDVDTLDRPERRPDQPRRSRERRRSRPRRPRSTPTRDVRRLPEGRQGRASAASRSPRTATHLFFVNLFDKSVYALDSPAETPTTATRIATLAGANQRPWAVAVHRDRLYVGYVDTRRGARSRQSAATAGLQLLRRRPSPWRRLEEGTPVGAPILTSPLGYAKGNNITGWPGPAPTGSAAGRSLEHLDR